MDKAFAGEIFICSGNQLGNGHERRGFRGIQARLRISNDHQ